MTLTQTWRALGVEDRCVCRHLGCSGAAHGDIIHAVSAPPRMRSERSLHEEDSAFRAPQGAARGRPVSGSRPGTATAITLRYGLGGGALAALAMLLPSLAAPGADARLGEYAGTMVALLAIHLGTRAVAAAQPVLGFGRRVGLAMLLVACASAVLGVGLYALYRFLRPDLLAIRYLGFEARLAASHEPAARVAAELARLAQQQAQYLDPAFQALTTAGTVFFFGMLLALYSAWRARVLARLGDRPQGTPPPPVPPTAAPRP
jgi:hypothetical protein